MASGGSEQAAAVEEARCAADEFVTVLVSNSQRVRAAKLFAHCCDCQEVLERQYHCRRTLYHLFRTELEF